MRARIWGCRGSLATPGPTTVRYGGNTSCVEVRPSDGSLIVLDAGTGIRLLGLALGQERPKEIHLLLTHMHLDHVEGLGFFLPLFDPDTQIHVWGPVWEERSLRDRIVAYLSLPLFPLRFEQIPARLHFHDVPEETFELGNVKVSAARVTHPGPTVAYRIEENGRSLAFVPDNGPALNCDIAAAPAAEVSGLELASGATVLMHDAQYTAEEYTTRVGWGHSALPDFAALVGRAQPEQVLMFHHEPNHTDHDLELMLGEARSLLPDRDITLAREGLELSLG